MHEAVVGGTAISVVETLSASGVLDSFCLSRGTAAALHLGHRESRDPDFFTKAPSNKLNAERVVESAQRGLCDVSVEYVGEEQVDFFADGVRTTFLAYPFRPANRTASWRGVAVADLRTIAAQKAYTIGRRPHARDDVDIDAIMHVGGVPLSQIIRDAESVYGAEFSRRLFLQQLTYTKDLKDKEEAIQLLVRQEPFPVVEERLSQAVREYVLTDLGRPRGPGLRR